MRAPNLTLVLFATRPAVREDGKFNASIDCECGTCKRIAPEWVELLGINGGPLSCRPGHTLEATVQTHPATGEDWIHVHERPDEKSKAASYGRIHIRLPDEGLKT